MKNTVNIPSSVKDINISIARERYANQRVIEELEMILDRTKLAVKIDSIRKHITSQIKLKR
jgi:hypothetical protein